MTLADAAESAVRRGRAFFASFAINAAEFFNEAETILFSSKLNGFRATPRTAAGSSSP